MGIIRIFLALSLGILGLWPPQTTIMNPEKPPSAKAGRVLQLKEELRITDDGGEFFLKYPRIVKIAPDGSSFVLDANALIHLDPKGRYLGNLFKKGQGPGELNFVSNFDFAGDNLIVHSSDPEKIVWYDFRGKFLKEISLARISSRLDFLFHAGGVYWFIKYDSPMPTGKAGAIDFPQIVLAVSGEGKTVREFMSFPNSGLLIRGAFVGQELLTASCRERYLFISNTRKHEIAAFDCQTGQLLRTFGRKYDRIKTPKDQKAAAIIDGNNRYEAPGSEYLRDLSALHVFKDRLWALTSTKDAQKGVLVDVFDLDGKYIDAFFLKLNGSLIGTHGDSILVREKSPDDLIQIVKYKVIDS
jgi:hypothetical protein